MSEEQEMSFLDHLEELRWHLIRAVAAIGVFTIIAFMSKSFVFGVVIFGPSQTDFFTYRKLCELSQIIGSDALCINELPFIIQNRTMTGQFTMHIFSSIVIGLICAFPYAFWEVWRFVKPGLYANERQITRGATFFVSLLFIIGILFGYYLVAPIAVNFLSNYQIDPSILNEIDLSSYVLSLAMMVLACGILFQLPMVIYFLSKVGLITPEFMRKYRRHAIVVILILSAMITPPDPVSQIFIAFPVFLLYQMSIMISAYVVRKQAKTEALELVKDDAYKKAQEAANSTPENIVPRDQ